MQTAVCSLKWADISRERRGYEWSENVGRGIQIGWQQNEKNERGRQKWLLHGRHCTPGWRLGEGVDTACGDVVILGSDGALSSRLTRVGFELELRIYAR